MSTVSGVPLPVLIAVAHQESGFNQNARSPAGALGIMQLMPGTAKALGVDPQDATQNMVGGAKYLGDLFRKFGSWPLAVAAYNAGPGAVEKYGGVPPFAETKNYVKSVMGMIGGLQ